jgi:3-oxoacyl-[acyl-carrier-protein] synthase-3
VYSRIAGTGSYLPARILTNFDLEQRMDTSDAWIRERTGIERRHIIGDTESNVDMAEHAARAAIAAAGLTPDQIDLITYGTTTPDLVFPNCGSLLQARLGCRGAPAFSLEAACSGFIYALAVADKFVRSGDSKRALVVGSEVLSRITDYSDRSTAILFGDTSICSTAPADRRAVGRRARWPTGI